MRWFRIAVYIHISFLGIHKPLTYLKYSRNTRQPRWTFSSFGVLLSTSRINDNFHILMKVYLPYISYGLLWVKKGCNISHSCNLTLNQQHRFHIVQDQISTIDRIRVVLNQGRTGPGAGIGSNLHSSTPYLNPNLAYYMVPKNPNRQGPTGSPVYAEPHE